MISVVDLYVDFFLKMGSWNENLAVRKLLAKKLAGELFGIQTLRLSTGS